MLLELVALVLMQFTRKPPTVKSLEPPKPVVVEVVKPEEPPKPLGPAPTVDELAEQIYQGKQQSVRDLQAKLADVRKQTDYSKLSAEAIAKIEKPHLDGIKKAQADKEIVWNYDYPFHAEMGEVFKFPRTNPRLNINDEHTIYYAIDTTSVAVTMSEERYRDLLYDAYTEKRLAAIGGDPKAMQKIQQEFEGRKKTQNESVVVIQGLKPTEFLERKGSLIKLSGLWRRVAPIRIDGADRVCIERFPGEEDLKKKWPNFIKAKEKAAKATEPKADEKPAEAKKKKT